MRFFCSILEVLRVELVEAGLEPAWDLRRRPALRSRLGSWHCCCRLSPRLSQRSRLSRLPRQHGGPPAPPTLSPLFLGRCCLLLVLSLQLQQRLLKATSAAGLRLAVVLRGLPHDARGEAAWRSLATDRPRAAPRFRLGRRQRHGHRREHDAHRHPCLILTPGLSQGGGPPGKTSGCCHLLQPFGARRLHCGREFDTPLRCAGLNTIRQHPPRADRTKQVVQQRFCVL